MQKFQRLPQKEGGIVAGKTEYKNNWQKENYDRINLTVPKGRKAAIQAHAAEHGESVNAFIARAIEETMERDKEKAGA